MDDLMKAVVIRAFGGPDVLEDGYWPIPDPAPGEVRIRIEATSVNPIDLAWRRGELGQKLPAVLGRDFSGTIDAIGEGICDLASGDRVWGYQAGLASNGSYAEYLCLPSLLVAKRPRTISALEAAAMPVVGLTAYKCVCEKAQVAAGMPVLVTGAAGGVGAMIVQLAQHAGASPIVATAGSDRSAAYLVDELGLDPDRIVRYRGLSRKELAAAVFDRAGGHRPHIAFDTVGGAMKLLAFDTVAVDGHVVSIVEEPADFPLNLWDETASPMSMRSLSFHFVELSAGARLVGRDALCFFRKGFDWLGTQVDAGLIRPPRIQDMGVLSADTARKAHRLLATGHAGGKLIMTTGSHR
ncbi:quinone oxidoreductase family protein [Erythrobacter colymbi]|uniref:quinone oxidoreductase family protein n=1 Tax=Erythrobacter colymbi TaxID=1161202 RepID=UPI000A3C27F0|nr:NADP-dependent oxidoreductase [Erythrobacter colymbi]